MYPLAGVCLFCLMALPHPLDLADVLLWHPDGLPLDLDEVAED